MKKQETEQVLTSSEDLPNWRYNIVKTINYETSFSAPFKSKELAYMWHEEFIKKPSKKPKQLILKSLPFILNDELKNRYQYFLIKTKIVEQPWTGSFETEQDALNWHKKYNSFWEGRGYKLKLEKIGADVSDNDDKVKVIEKTIYEESVEDQIENKKMSIKLGAVNEKKKIKLKASLNSK